MKRNPKDIFFVGVQFILFIVYLFRFPKIDFTVSHWLRLAGLLFSVCGIIISLASVFALNKNLSAFPTPKLNAVLIQSGIYKYIRHPIYSGILFFTFGFSMYSENTLRLLIFFMLLILFRFKAAYEEKLLQDTYSNYVAYKKTTGMFLPRMKLHKKKIANLNLFIIQKCKKPADLLVYCILVPGNCHKKD